MSELRVLLDEMLSPAVAEQLRKRGLDTVAVLERGELIGMPDEDLLDVATSEKRLLVTFNISDFAVIARTWRADARTHAGLVYLASREFPQNDRLNGRIVRALTSARDTASLPGADQELFLPSAGRPV